MIIYEFTTWCAGSGKHFAVNEIEVEEKQKIYVGKHCRINKSEIGILSSHYGNRMYLLENDPETYIKAMIERKERSVGVAIERLTEARKSLATWRSLAERSGK